MKLTFNMQRLFGILLAPHFLRRRTAFYFVSVWDSCEVGKTERKRKQKKSGSSQFIPRDRDEAGFPVKI